MKYEKFAICFFLAIIISCTNQNRIVFIPVPEDEYYLKEHEKKINFTDILQTKNDYSQTQMPQWLIAYINGGIEEVEKMDIYSSHYVFIEISEGVNFSALNKWTENFSVKYDFAILAASRIERKLISSASLYPDYEYGSFFEKMIKKAYSTEYLGAEKEDTFWIKLKNPEEAEVYYFIIFIIIEKDAMQSQINNIISETIAEAGPRGNQRNAINRLRQSFFEDF